MPTADSLNADGRLAIEELVSWHRRHYQNTDESRPLFPSRHKAGTVPMHRQTAHDVLKKAFIAAGLNGKLATHSLRESFAQRLYDKSGDIYLVQELLGHRNISTTQNYLGVNYADARAAVESIALITESGRMTFCITRSKTSLRKRSKLNSNAADTTPRSGVRTSQLRRSSKSHDLYARDNDEGKNKKG